MDTSMRGAGLLTGTATAHKEVYPGVREQPGTDRPVEELVSEMTLDEIIKRVHNHLGPLPDFSTGYVAALPRLNIPDFRMADQSASVDRPPKELKAFNKIELLAGESTTVEFSFDADDLAFYDIEEEAWSVESGEFEVLVGRSSRDIRTRATFRASGGI